MNRYSDELLMELPRRGRPSRYRASVLVVVALAAILFQVYVPLFFEYLSYLELSLLVTVYFSLMKRNPVSGTFIGCAIGLAQDSLSHHPIGMLGIVKSLVGYFSASVSLRFDVDNPLVRMILAFFFFFFHQFFHWVLMRALLGQAINFDFEQTLLFGLFNAIVALPLFHIFDRMRRTG